MWCSATCSYCAALCSPAEKEVLGGTKCVYSGFSAELHHDEHCCSFTFRSFSESKRRLVQTGSAAWCVSLKINLNEKINIYISACACFRQRFRDFAREKNPVNAAILQLYWAEGVHILSSSSFLCSAWLLPQQVSQAEKHLDSDTEPPSRYYRVELFKCLIWPQIFILTGMLKCENEVAMCWERYSTSLMSSYRLRFKSENSNMDLSHLKARCYRFSVQFLCIFGTHQPSLNMISWQWSLHWGLFWWDFSEQQMGVSGLCWIVSYLLNT